MKLDLDMASGEQYVYMDKEGEYLDTLWPISSNEVNNPQAFLKYAQPHGTRVFRVTVEEVL